MYSHEALAEVFGETYAKLSNPEKHALQTDVQEIYEEDPEQFPLYAHAAAELRRRIGGVGALPIYARVLTATLRNR